MDYDTLMGIFIAFMTAAGAVTWWVNRGSVEASNKALDGDGHRTPEQIESFREWEREANAKQDELYRQLGVPPVERKTETASTVGGFEKRWIHAEGQRGIAIDFDQRKIALCQRVGRWEKHDFAAIVECEVEVDSQSIVKSNKLGMVGMAAIGGALAGPVGALIGAAGRTQRSLEKVRSVHLKVLIKSVTTPIVRIEFSPNSAGIELAKEWHDLLAVAMKS